MGTASSCPYCMIFWEVVMKKVALLILIFFDCLLDSAQPQVTVTSTSLGDPVSRVYCPAGDYRLVWRTFCP